MLVYYSARAPALKSEVAALSPLSRQARARQGSGMDFSGWRNWACGSKCCRCRSA
jgi:hypothetical protein